MSVARLWRGATRRADADRYVAYLQETGLADYLATPGNRGAEILRRDVGDRTLFTVRSTWRSLDDIRAFAGDDVEAARFYPEDDAFLVHREPRVEHHAIASEQRPTGAVATVDHVKVRVGDIAAAAAFYEAALAPLGVGVIARGDDGSCGFGRDGAGDDFWIEPGGSPGAPLHVAFAAEGHDQVDAFHAAALAAGGRDNGPPGLRPKYSEHYYGAFVLDPDGNNVEAVTHVPRRSRA